MRGLDAIEPWGGHLVLENTLRLGVIFVGITLALIALKIGWGLWRVHHAPERAWGALAFALIVATPSVRLLAAFDDPMVWPAFACYALGLLAAVISLGYRITIAPPWARYRGRGPAGVIDPHPAAPPEKEVP